MSIVLRKTASAQTLKFIPRTYVQGNVTARFYDEQLNTSADVTITLSTVDFYSQGSGVFTLVEDRHYLLEILNGSIILYTDKVFCTNQTDYTINSGEYVSNSNTNQYAVR